MKLVLLVIFLMCSVNLIAAVDSLPSAVYYWQKAKPVHKNGTEYRQLAKGSTLDLNELDISNTVLKPGQNATGPVFNMDRDELIIVKDGNLRISIGDSLINLGPGGIAFLVAGARHELKNVSASEASYYSLKFKPDSTINFVGQRSANSVVKDWKDMEVRKTDKGLSRPIFDVSTPMFQRFDMHATALNPGFASHLPHTHRSEEIILMITGSGEIQIGNAFHKASAGDVILLGANVPHAFTNTGDRQCGYFAIQWRK